MIQPTYKDFANGFRQLYHLTITFVTRYHARHQEKSACGTQQLTWNLKNTHLKRIYCIAPFQTYMFGISCEFSKIPTAPKVFFKESFPANGLICILSFPWRKGQGTLLKTNIAMENGTRIEAVFPIENGDISLLSWFPWRIYVITRLLTTIIP